MSPPAVTRLGDVALPLTPTIEKVVLIKAPPKDIFDALTNPEKILAIFPLSRAAIDLRPGGRLLLSGTADGRSFSNFGTVEAVEPFHLFQYRYWGDNHGTMDAPVNQVVLRNEMLMTASARLSGGDRRFVPHRNRAAFAFGMP